MSSGYGLGDAATERILQRWLSVTPVRRKGVSVSHEETAVWEAFGIGVSRRGARDPLFLGSAVEWAVERRGPSGWIHIRRGPEERLETYEVADGATWGYPAGNYTGFFVSTSRSGFNLGPEFFILPNEAKTENPTVEPSPLTGRGRRAREEEKKTTWGGSVTVSVVGVTYESVAALRRQGFYLSRASVPGKALYPPGAATSPGFPFDPMKGLSNEDLEAADWMALAVSSPGPGAF